MTDRRHSVRFSVPHSIVQGRDTLIEAPVYLSGALVNPSAATLTVFNAGGEEVVAAGTAATITGSVATYTVTTAMVASEDIGAGWRVVWALTIAGDALTAENDAALVKRQLYNVVTDADLFRRVKALDPNDSAPITLATDYQTELDEAWVEIENRIYQDGRRPEWVRSPSSLRAATVFLTLALIFEGLETRNPDGFEGESEKYMARYESAYASISALVDLDGDGEPDSLDRQGMKPSVVWLG